ncbi:hypothetical protein EDB19DRAFT_1714942, partial [Suillus lakei]
MVNLDEYIEQSARRCNLSVDTFTKLGKIRTNLQHHSTVKNVEAGKSTRHRHVETAQELEASFAWAPPLSTEP